MGQAIMCDQSNVHPLSYLQVLRREFFERVLGDCVRWEGLAGEKRRSVAQPCTPEETRVLKPRGMDELKTLSRARRLDPDHPAHQPSCRAATPNVCVRVWGGEGGYVPPHPRLRACRGLAAPWSRTETKPTPAPTMGEHAAGEEQLAVGAALLGVLRVCHGRTWW